MRRFIASLLALIVLLLTVFPCCDEGCAQASGAAEPTILTAAHKNADDCRKDSCSPFCACAACCAAIVLPEAVLLRSSPFFPLIPEQKFTVHAQVVLRGNNSAIWQPPRMV